MMACIVKIKGMIQTSCKNTLPFIGYSQWWKALVIPASPLLAGCDDLWSD